MRHAWTEAAAQFVEKEGTEVRVECSKRVLRQGLSSSQIM